MPLAPSPSHPRVAGYPHTDQSDPINPKRDDLSYVTYGALALDQKIRTVLVGQIRVPCIKYVTVVRVLV